jgi:ATP-dependent DNA helicase PIF1
MSSSPVQRVSPALVDARFVRPTGAPGTGKSVLLREIISALKAKHKRPDAVAVTASTGMAACNIGGTTIHSFGGLGLAADAIEGLIGKVKKNRKASSRWTRAAVLIIDEVSMVDGDLFDKLAAVACALRTKDKGKPFGGLQLVITGDFFQLPPVSKGGTNFAFDAKQWKECIQHTVNLTQVFRQKDTQFIDMLNEMRFGTLSPKSIAKFQALARKPDYPPDGIEPTELFPTRDQVDNANRMRLDRLPGQARDFAAEDGGDADPRDRVKLFDNMLAPSKLSLKVGAQVMLIKNKDESLVNGTTGQIVKFAPAGADPTAVGYDDFDEEDEGKLVPQEFNSGEHEFHVYSEGKPRILKGGDEVVPLKKTAIKSQEDVPWVQWILHDGRKMAPEPLAREEFKVEQGTEVRARRKQVGAFADSRAGLMVRAVSHHSSLGGLYPQKSRANLGSRQGRSIEGV